MSDRFNRRAASLAAFIIYLAFAIAVLDRGLFAPDAHRYLGINDDPLMMTWFLNWWPYAIAHRLDPFWSYSVWAPPGFNLTWTTCVPLLSLVSAPIQKCFGLLAAYNLLVTIAMPAAGWCAFILCRRLTDRFVPSLIGGYLFGFSAYMLGRALGHLSLMPIFSVPLIVLAAVRRLDAEISARRYIAILAALVTVEFLCSVELYATTATFGTLAMLLAFSVCGAKRRRAMGGLIASTAIAYAISIALLAPYLYRMLSEGIPGAPVWAPWRYSADLANLVIPTSTVWIGTLRDVARIGAHFAGTIQENGAYLGLPLIAVAEDFRRHNWTTPAGKLLIVMLLSMVIASFGPRLRIMGELTAPMPWDLALNLPLISSAMPARFSMYASLAIAVIAALWFAGPRNAAIKWIAGGAILISFLPNPTAAFWTGALEMPAFFAEGGYRDDLRPNEIVLLLPYRQRGLAMYWQTRSAMYFRMANGYTGITPFEFERMPAAQFFYGAIDLPEAGDQVKAYLARFHVEAVLADERDPLFPLWRSVLDSLGSVRMHRGGMAIYPIPRGAFAGYAELDPAEIEARAVTLRFDTILAASAKFLARNHRPQQLSRAALKQDGLLPGDWVIDPPGIVFRDWDVGSLPDGRTGIAMLASWPAAKVLIDRYQGAAKIFYPAATPWTPDSKPPNDRVEPLLIVFDRAQLQAAADRLRTSPPPELTTRFPAARAGLANQTSLTAGASTGLRPGPVSGSR